MIKIQSDKTKKETITFLRHADSAKVVGSTQAICHNPLTKENIYASSLEELINKMIGYRDKETHEYVEGMMSPEDLPSDELYSKLRNQKGFTSGAWRDAKAPEFTSMVVYIPSSVPPEKWDEWRLTHFKRFSEPHEVFYKNQGNGVFTSYIHEGDTLTFVSPIHDKQDGAGPHFHLISHCRTLNNKNYIDVDNNGNLIVDPVNPNDRYITAKAMFSNKSEFRDKKVENINNDLIDLGLTPTRWLKKDEAVNEEHLKAKDKLSDIEDNSDINADLNRELEELNKSEELIIAEFSEKDIKDATLHKEIINNQKLLAVITKSAQEKLADAYKEVELVKLTRQAINNSISLAHTQEQLVETKAKLESTEDTLKDVEAKRQAFQDALEAKNNEFNVLNDKHDSLIKSHEELTGNYDDLEAAYGTLETTLSTTKAQHVIDLQNKDNAHAEQISILHTTHTNAVKQLNEEHAEKLSEQEVFYENALSEKDAQLTAKDDEITQLKEAHAKALEALNSIIDEQKETIVARDETITELSNENTAMSNEINQLKADKQHQREEFDRIINELKEGHLEAVDKLTASNTALTTEVANQIKAVEELKEANESLKEENEKVSQEFKALQEDFKKLAAENKDLDEALKIYEEDNQERTNEAKNKNKKDDPKTPKNK